MKTLKKIRYDDNIFFLTSLIRSIDEAIQLDVDPEFFVEKIIEDILFIDSTIQKLYLILKNNSRLLDSHIYLHCIVKVKKCFTDLLEKLPDTNERIGNSLNEIRARLARITIAHLNDIRDIQQILLDSAKVKTDVEVLSHDEFDVLMSPLDDMAEI